MLHVFTYVLRGNKTVTNKKSVSQNLRSFVASDRPCKRVFGIVS